MKRNIMKDTILLTVIQMSLDGLGLLLNAFMTRQLGTESMGVLTLTGSFFRLAAMTASGNVFLCASRFISEELGKQERNPKKILAYCLLVSLVLSILISGIIIIFAPWCGMHFLKSEELTAPIRLMALSLPLITITACLKGYCNACCKTAICAISDAIDFLIHTGLTAGAVWLITPVTHAGLCYMTALCTIGSTAVSLIFLLFAIPSCKAKKTGKASISLKKYIQLAIPVMAGSALTSLLSSANDALVPITLQQSGDSSTQALSQFGIFEAIVIPVLFFPSTLLVSLSGILVTETARETASCNKIRITYMTEKVIRQTIIFAIFIIMLLLLFGDEIGELLGGGITAGKTIVFIAPVVPFIYLEIILESIIKGIGAQAFSSLNYLAEYVVRISFVLIFIPILGFYGIVLSYYASNLFGNISRLVLVIKRTGMEFSFIRMLGIPIFSAILSAQLIMLVFHVIHILPNQNIFSMIMFAILSCVIYLMIQKELFHLHTQASPVCNNKISGNMK
ncbi:MAG: oligosaccharide flippase family protein [Oscillospiraceae bacterium]|nr:oligosaccharide flippase family protein [Oscillospiraceae bacterium]